MPSFTVPTANFEISRIMSRLGRSVVLVRNGAVLAAQTAIVQSVNTSAFTFSTNGGAGRSEHNNMVLIGYHNHSPYADFDVMLGDRFSLDGQQYEVVFISKLIPHRVEAIIRQTM